MQRNYSRENALYNLYKKDTTGHIVRSLALAAPVAQAAVTLAGYAEMGKQADSEYASCYILMMFTMSQLAFAIANVTAVEAMFGLNFEGRGFSKKQYSILAAILVLNLATIINLNCSLAPNLNNLDRELFLKAGLIAAFGTFLSDVVSGTATLFYAANKKMPIREAHIEMFAPNDCAIM